MVDDVGTVEDVDLRSDRYALEVTR